MRKLFIASLGLLSCQALRAPDAAGQAPAGERRGPAPVESAPANQPIRVDMPGQAVRSGEGDWALYFPPGSRERRPPPRTAAAAVTLLERFFRNATGTQLCDFLTQNHFADQDTYCDSDANGFTFGLRDGDPVPLRLTILARSYPDTVIPWVKYHFNLSSDPSRNRGIDPRIAARDLLEFWRNANWQGREGLAVRRPEETTGPLTLFFRRTEPEDPSRPAGRENRFTLERLNFYNGPIAE